MVRIRVIKNYDDIVLVKKVVKGDIFEVDEERARKLVGLNLVEVLSIDKLKKKGRKL